MTRRSIRYGCGGRSLDMRISDSGGGRFSIACCADVVMSTKRNVSCAVLPSRSFRRAGSCSPGTCTRMRLAPWRWIRGSTVPSSSTRRRTISIDWVTAWLTRLFKPASVKVSRITLSPASDTSTSRPPVGPSAPLIGVDSSRNLVSASGTSFASRRRSWTREVLRRKARVSDAGIAHHAPNVIAQA